MKTFIRTAFLASMLLTSMSAANAQVSFGIRIGPPPAPRVYVHPARPGPDYIWVDGYWYPVGGRYKWHEGYWTRAPYDGAIWVGPRYENGQFFEGYWEGRRGRFEHDHRWDRDRDRDWNRYHDHDNHDRDRDHR